MMKDKNKTKEQLITELGEMRQRIAKLEATESGGKKTESQLPVSDEYRRLFELLPVGITVLDMKGVIIDCNPAVDVKSGYTRDDFVGKHFSKIATTRAGDIPKFMKVFASLIRGKVPKPFEVMYTRKDGTTGWTELHINLLKSDSKKKRILVIQHDITERRRAEEQTIVANERLQYLLSSSPAVIYSSKTTGDYGATFVSDNVTQVFGYEPREFTGNSRFWLEHVYPDDVELIFQEVPRLFEQGWHSYEFRFRRKDGVYVWVRDEMKLVRDAEGKPVEIIGYWADINKRRKAEEALLNFKTAADTAIYGMGIGTFEHLTYVNRSFAEMHGYLPDELIGQNYSMLYTKEQLPIINKLREQLLAGGSFIGEEVWHKKKDGTSFPTLMTGHTIRDDEGNPSLIVGTTIDITERKRAEDEIRKFKAITDNANYGVTMVTLDDKFAYVNETYAEMHGYKVDEIVGKEFKVLYSKEQLPVILRLNERLMQTGSFVNEEVWHSRKDGTIFPTIMNAKLMSDDRGKPLYKVGTIIDITERKRAEEALRESEEKFSSAFHSNPHPMSIVTMAEGQYLGVNDSYVQTFGFSREELLGRTTVEMGILKNDRARRKILQSLKEKQAVKNLEVEFHTRSGRKVDALLSNDKMEIGGQTCLLSVITDITERKRAEEEVAGLAKFPSENPNPVLRVAKDGTILYANNASSVLLNVWGSQVGQLLPEQMLKLLSDVFDAGANRTTEVEYNDRVLSLIIAPIVEVGYANLYGLDITERKQQEREREFARRLLETANLGHKLVPTLRQFVQAIKDYAGCAAVGIRILDGKGNIPYQAYEGFSREFYESESPLSIKSDQCMCINVIKGDTDPSLPFYTEDGSFYLNGTTAFLATVSEEEKGSTRNVCNEHGYESVALVPIRLESSILGLIHVADTRTDTVPLTLVNTLEDIAPQIGLAIRRLWAEQELAEEKERLEVTLRSTSDGIISSDMDGIVLLLNKAAEEMTGWTQKEAAGRAIREVFNVIDERNRKPIPNAMENVLKTGRLIGLVNHAVLISRDGTERLIADSGAPMHDEQGRMLGVVLVFRDITELQQLREEQLRVVKLESVGTLAGGIAHDFNNLLTGIMGNISLAKRHVEPESKALKRLEEAEKASVRARDLTQQLLTFAGGGVPIKKLSSIGEIIQETTGFALSGSNISCKFSLADDLWAVAVDEGQISQVIHNIVLNADEAMPSGGTLHISAQNMVIKRLGALPIPRGDYVRVDIEDEGIGISKGQLERMFEPYYTTKQKGSGLGLATAFSIVRNHGGYITAESKVGVGTKFFVYIPASTEPMPEKEGVAAEVPIMGKGRILVMDDEEIVRQLLEAELTDTGYEVELTRNGAEAIERYEDAKKSGNPFDAVILDLTVPGGMGGKEAIEKLLEIDPDIKAIVSSGYATDPIMSAYKKYGFSAVVAKPYSVAEIEKTLLNLLSKRK